MPSFKNALLVLVTAAATAQAERLRVVWSAGSFSAMAGPKGAGGGSGYKTGFAIINEDGEAIYDEDYPYDYAPCFQNDGRDFEIVGECWDSYSFMFHCVADFGGNPESCAVKDWEGNVLAEGESGSGTDFKGISINTGGACVAEFESDGPGCPADDNDLYAINKG